MQLYVIKGGNRKSETDYFSIYNRVFVEKLWFLSPDCPDRQFIKQIVWAGVKMINHCGDHKHINHDRTTTKLRLFEAIKGFISLLTPAELLTIFPITKTYDEKRWGCKDYFYTIDALNNIGMDELIGDKVDDLLWSYTNPDLDRFTVNFLCTISDLKRLNGEKGLAEEFADEFGIILYSKTVDRNGRDILIDNKTKNCIRIKKFIPRYLRLVGG